MLFTHHAVQVTLPQQDHMGRLGAQRGGGRWEMGTGPRSSLPRGGGGGGTLESSSWGQQLSLGCSCFPAKPSVLPGKSATNHLSPVGAMVD